MFEVRALFARSVAHGEKQVKEAIVLNESILNAQEGNSIRFSACKDDFIEMSDSREAQECDAYQFSTRSL